MKSLLIPGIAIGLGCVAWTFVMGFTGWYKHPTLLHLFWVVVAIQVSVLVWALGRTAREGRGYWAQVGAGTTMSLIAAVIIFCGSLLFTVVVFPDYFTELAELQRQILTEQGKSAAEIDAALAATAPGQTPLAQAVAGAFGTAVTGFVVSLIIAAFCRHRG